MWLKYSDAPIVHDPAKSWAQPTRARAGAYSKPSGCWITDDSDNCWKSWCAAEQFLLERLTHKHVVTIDESRLLILRGAQELDAFDEPCLSGFHP